MSAPNRKYTMTEWSHYAQLHASVTTTHQLAVYKETSHYLMGDVVDCGCGTAKIAPLLIDKQNIKSYTGIDYAEEMVTVADKVIQRLQKPSYIIQCCRIEAVRGKFTSALSIQSYYSWSDPLVVLKNIYRILANDAIFILATPNPKINLEGLIYDATKELIAHPDFEAFKQYNIQLANNIQANFITMNDLIKQVQSVGFSVLECHQRHFNGGLNYLLLQKN